MNYPRIFNRVLNSNWAILPNYLESIFQVLTARNYNLTIGAEVSKANFKEAKEKRADGFDRIRQAGPEETGGKEAAHVFYSGIVGKHLSWMDEVCAGGLSIDRIAADLRKIEADESIDTVILHLDSPGGTVYGVPELAAQIRGMTESKRVIGYTDSLAASAAYWILSACDEVWASPSADVGSIGVYCAMIDYCAFMEKNGLKLELFKAGEYKAAGLPGLELTDTMREKFQADVDALYEMFTADVREGRAHIAGGISDDTMQGQTLTARQALEAGLIDGIANDVRELLGQI